MLLLYFKIVIGVLPTCGKITVIVFFHRLNLLIQSRYASTEAVMMSVLAPNP